jgi:chromosomal replication initiation ATPase DnaA
MNTKQILKRACQAVGTTEAAIKAKQRDEATCNKRHLVFLMMKNQGVPYNQIGIATGFKHGTVIHGCKRITGLATIYPLYRDLIQEATQRFA